MENKPTRKVKAFVYLPIFFALVMALGVYVGIILSYNRLPEVVDNKFRSIGFGKYDKINDILNFVYESYVDTVNKDWLTEETIRTLLRNLDPHSVYIPASEFRAMNDPLLGSFEGIGIEFNMVNDTVVVISPLVGGPSEKAGIQAGDRIVKVDGEDIAGVKMSTDEIVRRLKGPKDTEVDVTVYRHQLDELFDFTITRDKIPSFSVDIAYMLDEQTGYIKISRFAVTSHQEFIAAFERLKREGLEKLVLDLRGNGGGILDAAVSIADEFIAPGDLIVYTQGHKRPKKTAHARRNGRFESQPLVVLIDEWSASASEIIAGAVQDNDRGLVIGRRSFGKGLVQEQVMLSDGSAVRLTVARYYTPSGRSIQSPYDTGTDKYYDEFMQRFIDGEHESVDSIKQNDTLKYTTRNGRVVYAGGGIMPDIFVPFDSGERTPFFNMVAGRGLVYRFAFNHADNNRDVLSQRYGSAQNFVKTFRISDSLFNDFLRFIKDNGVEPDMDNMTKSRPLIEMQIKAYIGRNIFGNEAFFPVLNAKDRTLNEALQALEPDNYEMHLKPEAEQ